MELSIRVGNKGTLMTREAAQIAERIKLHDATVLLRRENITVNAKSLLGLLSLQLQEGEGVTIIAKGEDEAQAVCAMAQLMGA